MNRLPTFSGACLLFTLALLHTGASLALAKGDSLALEDLKPSMHAHGFQAAALYLDDADRPMGARFVHEKTGFTFDLLRIQSVPQGFMWVNSFPTSDMGEPHTQEHLLLGKGNMGRYVANLEDMALSGSSAFTMQWRTCYHFNTAAGPDVYYRLFEDRLNALLHPDYTDEEIRREVCNFGVTENPSDGTLRLEEKGTVYNEMVSSFERPWFQLSHAMDLAIYGPNHPLSYVSGGLPSAIREMKPEAIRLFHREHYFLGNMGMVAALPKEMPLDDILARTDSILVRLEVGETKREGNIVTAATLPAPQGAAPGSIIMAEFPNSNEATPAPVVLAWPAQLSLDTRERTLLELFLSNVAGDASTNLYKLFIDTKTRKKDVGAQGVFGWVSSDQGNPIFIGLDDYAPANMTKEKLEEVRKMVMEEIRRIESWQEGSPELKEFNDRMLSRVISVRRDMAKFVNSPPGFGFRSTGSNWMMHLEDLAGRTEFLRSVTMKQDLESLEKRLGSGRNIWRRYIGNWKLTTTEPYIIAAHPSAAMVDREEAERRERIAAKVNALKRSYGVSDDQEAIRRYAAEYDAMTAELDSIAAQTPRVPFIDSPPLTLDDQLDYREMKLAGNVPLVASTFDNMTSGRVGIAFRLDGIPENQMVYLSILPRLLTGTGVIEKNKALSYEEMSERLRKEILSLDADFSSNSRNGRVELVVRGSGNDLAETQRSLEWMDLVLQHPNWTKENLPRLRDLVDQTLAGLRSTIQGREEAWVNDPAAAYRRQDNLLLLSTRSFLTQTHNTFRLRWMLKDPGQRKERDAIARFLAQLASASTASRKDLQGLLAAMQSGKDRPSAVAPALDVHLKAFAALPGGARDIALEAARDLDLTLADIPDASLAQDWAYLCGQIRHDLLLAPSKTLDDLNAVRKRILLAANARMFMIGSREHQEKLAAGIDKLVAGLGRGRKHSVSPSSTPHIARRLQERMPGATDPVFVGLVNPNTGSGVFLHSALNTSYWDTTRPAMLDYLTAQVFGGGGAHGIFMKTWGAGLAYSNGIGSGPASGRMSYYAERCPELSQTMRFVIDEIRRAPVDTGLVDYAIAQAFGEVRSPSGYESRGEAMAADLADGVTPELVSRFRRRILALRNTPGLADELFARREAVYGKILTGYGISKKDVAGGIYFIIGPEKQFDLYEQYLKTVEGADARLYRLYPRDFWIPLREAGLEVQRN